MPNANLQFGNPPLFTSPDAEPLIYGRPDDSLSTIVNVNVKGLGEKLAIRFTAESAKELNKLLKNPDQLQAVLDDKFEEFRGAIDTIYQGLPATDKAALWTSPIPIVGDAAGIVADMAMYMRDPESRTLFNSFLTAASAIPLVPAVSAGRKMLNGKPVETIDELVEYADTKGVKLQAAEWEDYIHVNGIEVPYKQQGKGLGTEIMQAVNDLADRHGKPVQLSATDELGGDVERLESWYKGMGYVENDYSDDNLWEGMVRQPKPADVSEVVKRNITAWHGSPHRFDRFSMAEIGKGEGAQAYGHGLYFAENPAVAKEYARPGRHTNHTYKKPMPPAGTPEAEAIELVNSLNIHGNEDFRGQPAKIIDYYLEAPDAEQPELTEAIKKLSPDDFETLSNMYKVGLDVDPESLLDWELPLSKQPKAVRDAIMKSEIAEEYADSPNMLSNFTGAQLYNKMGELLYEKSLASGGTKLTRGGVRDVFDKKSSERFKELGIPGARYFDQQSRVADSANEGRTRNYVIFDDSLVDIIPPGE